MYIKTIFINRKVIKCLKPEPNGIFWDLIWEVPK